MNVYHFTIAWRNLVQGGRRVRLLGIALAAVAGLLILLLSLSNGIHQNLIRAATTIASGHVNVAGFYKTSPNAIGAPVVNNRDEIKAVIKDASPHIVSIIDRHRGWAKMVTALCGLAFVKAYMVAIYYMHLGHETLTLRFTALLPMLIPVFYALILCTEGAARLYW